MKILRTPDERFAGLPGYPFAPNWMRLGELRMHYVDEGPREGTDRGEELARIIPGWMGVA